MADDQDQTPLTFTDRFKAVPVKTVIIAAAPSASSTTGAPPTDTAAVAVPAAGAAAGVGAAPAPAPAAAAAAPAPVVAPPPALAPAPQDDVAMYGQQTLGSIAAELARLCAPAFVPVTAGRVVKATAEASSLDGGMGYVDHPDAVAMVAGNTTGASYAPRPFGSFTRNGVPTIYRCS
ncbi:hypothetical protein ABH924_004827 [Arthrobacter sp. GAS37]|uniref:hypothetical protein n=1 Tax=Arthrobacter sp. GAS37 TaxID=3156261 RepID=UPI0038380258